MKVLVVYDSMFGNTAQVATAIGDALRGGDEVTVVPVAEATPARMAEAELLFVGSPTQRFRPLPAVSELLKRLPGDSLASVRVAAFDTRIEIAEANSRILSFMVRLLGPSSFAAPRIEAALRRAGGTLAAPFEGFIVDGTEGPLREGELERAAQWARRAAGANAVRVAAEAPRQAAPSRTRVPS
ncbi:MAG: flavodoxin family protein [Deinococcales bacterium]